MGSAPSDGPAARSAAPPRPRRADAQRSIARIVAAARRELGRDPAATVDDVARAAGVGRMTLYGHFPTRAALVEAALVDALRAGEEVLSGVDLSGDARQAVHRLLTASWSLVAESVGLLAAAEGTVPAERLHRLHGPHARRVETLIRRGQREGVFRTDLPLVWLTNAAHLLVHGAAGEVLAGRLAGADASRVVSASVLGVLAPPDPAAR
ncbi:TetR/AcrR family transcriptional regulator [Pseudonocardia sichuanensis]